MKNFHNVGTAAAIAFATAGSAILWVSFSGAFDFEAQKGARFAFKVWLVVGGVFWSWYFREERLRANPTHFTDATEFTSHLEMHATFEGSESAASNWFASGKTPNAVVATGSEGFSARLRRIEGENPTANGMLLAVQLLVPAKALTSFPVGAKARVLIDSGPAGMAEVLRVVS
jgi:hypothetical protein